MKKIIRIRLWAFLFLAMAGMEINAQVIVHQVQRGETLKSVADMYGLSEEVIRKANPNIGTTLYTGTKIVIPAKVANNGDVTPQQQTQVIVYEQSVKSKKKARQSLEEEKYYGARQGGFAISFGANPVIDFVGNMFNGTTKQSFEGFKGLGTDLFSGATMTGKYMLRDNVALTLGLGFDNNKTTRHTYGEEDKETQVKTDGNSRFMLMVGGQYLLRPGKRLQPLLGVNLAYGYSNLQYTHTDNKEEGTKDTETKNPANTFGLLGNIGVEYYITKAISLSATVDLGVSKTWTNKKDDDGENKYSHLESTECKVKTGQFGGNLAINFYF